MNDYKEKYMLAMERAKNFIENGDEGERTIAESIFAGIMEESEDEKIRKALMQNLKERFGTKGNMGKGLDMPDVLAWFEKQETSYTKRDVDDAYLKGVTDTKNEIEKQYEANYQIRKDIATFIFSYRGDIKDRAKWIDYLGIKVSFVKKQGEQKSDEWSEEDERIRIETIKLLETANHPNKMRSNGKPLDFTENINWLKSLRLQATWRPSDEKIEALEKVLKYFHLSKAHGKTIDGLEESLEQLLNQLKKLREE